MGDNETFPVDFTSVFIFVQDLLSIYLFITLRDNGNEEVKQDDTCDNDVQEPKEPDERYHHIALKCLNRVFNGLLVLDVIDPYLITRWSNITNGVSENL